MNQPKVFEFAKELGLETLALMDKIREWKMPVKNHMAELDADLIQEIRSRLLAESTSKSGAQKKAKTTKKKAAGTSSSKASPQASGTTSSRASAPATGNGARRPQAAKKSSTSA